MSLTNRKILWEDGTTDGFQTIRMPFRAPLGGVAYAEKDDDAVPYDQMVQYFIDNMGGGGSGTVTEVTGTLGSTGNDISLTINSPTTTPDINLQIPTASSTKRGALSSTDWSTFNNKGGGDMKASFYDPAGLVSQVIVSPISKTVLEMQSLLNTTDGSGIVIGQEYVVSNIGASYDSVKFLIVKGDWILNNHGDTIKGFNNIATCYLVDDAKQSISCRYDVKTNTLVAFRKLIGTITQVSADKPSINIFENTLGEVPALEYMAVGDYKISFSVVDYLSKGKTFVNFGNPTYDVYHVNAVLDALYYSYEVADVNTIRIYSIDGSIFMGVDEAFKETYFEIIHKI